MKKSLLVIFLLVSFISFAQQQYKAVKIKGLDVYDFVLPTNYQTLDTLLLQSDIHRSTFNASTRSMLSNKIPKIKRRYPTATGVIIFEMKNSDYIVVIREISEPETVLNDKN